MGKKIVTKEYKKVHQSAKAAKSHEENIKSRGNVRAIEKSTNAGKTTLKYKFFKK